MILFALPLVRRCRTRWRKSLQTNEKLKTDFWGRFTNIRDIRPVYLFLTCSLMLGSILLAQAISVAFGYSPDQFIINGQYTLTSGVFPVWFFADHGPRD